MNGFARGLVGLTILAGVCIANGVSGCATGTEIDGPATITGEDTDSGLVADDGGGTNLDDGGNNIITEKDSGSGGGKDSGGGNGTDSGGPCAGEVVVNEVQSDGASASDEFIELYNPAGCSLSLKDFKVSYYSSSANSGGAPLIMFTGTASHSIPSKGYFLLGGSGFTPPAGGKTDGSITGGLAASAGRVGITDAAGKLLDSVAYGTQTGPNTYVEANPAPAPASKKSIGRKPDGTDSDNNAVDFTVLSSPSPGKAN